MSLKDSAVDFLHEKITPQINAGWFVTVDQLMEEGIDAGWFVTVDQLMEEGLVKIQRIINLTNESLLIQYWYGCAFFEFIIYYDPLYHLISKITLHKNTWSTEGLKLKEEIEMIAELNYL